MEMRLKIIILSVMALVSSEIGADNRYHVFLYNYTPYQVEGTASFDNCPYISPVTYEGQSRIVINKKQQDLPINPAVAQPNKATGKIGSDEATMARVDVTGCTHTGIKVTVTTLHGSVVLQSSQIEKDHVWYEVKEVPKPCGTIDEAGDKHCISVIYLTRSDAPYSVPPQLVQSQADRIVDLKIIEWQEKAKK
jgi:hypothetical protein